MSVQRPLLDWLGDFGLPRPYYKTAFGAAGAYPRRFRQVSWWGFGGGLAGTETDENARDFAQEAEVP